MTNQELRDNILRDIKAAYRDIKRLNCQLNTPAMKRVYRTICPARKARDEQKSAYRIGIMEAEDELLLAWDRLPEVDKRLPPTARLKEAMAFGASLTRHPYRRKYMKNQLQLTT